jgi:hypothetical protein
MSKRNHKHGDELKLASAPATQQPEGGASPAEIAEAAYRRWVERGCPQGSAEEDWLEAERELKECGPNRATPVTG